MGLLEPLCEQSDVADVVEKQGGKCARKENNAGGCAKNEAQQERTRCNPCNQKYCAKNEMIHRARLNVASALSHEPRGNAARRLYLQACSR